ncbi:c-type cytochrome biogenesis protein CcmI [Kaistia algarum]|uniref:c-type cytochrome biogenesis protein CcmI n=1 Tax=Kaistia algarum TaxID=2083279 RepID=UPI000CE91F75|nr:c-type cytochrome biogenesis protein CcmI [Kaistia algarum]MCX5512105.1 c-type cytochrome biogenesis protein CcmI [Kaistia algarum]PPE80219.1 c-type cytochrome biogenesis protein CcmI [Kaistia algarum]
MLLWIAMAVLTAAASLAILVPLGRSRAGAVSADPSARAIYRDQLTELDRDRERGLIGEAETDAARLEISRRLLKTDEASAADPAGSSPVRALATFAAVIAIPLIAVGTYLALGSPNLIDQPIAERRAAAADPELESLVLKVETHLAQDPEDGKGWEVLGPVYMRVGRFDDAARAFDNSRRILGATPERDAFFGEAVTRAHGGLVTEEARTAFERALQGDPGNARARFYLAVALSQSGRKDEAIAAWNGLIADSPADAPWLPVAKAELEKVQGGSAGPVATGPMASSQAAPGPTAADVAAASQQTPAARQQMIEGMVAGLAARLDASPDDAEGWARLFRAYIVLGRPADAQAALDKARKALAGNSTVLAAVEKAAADNGVGTAP